MGDIQLEILHRLMLDRFHREISFGPGTILYKETIAAPSRGAGHFEPLRHYAEAHVLLEPLPRGSGIEVISAANSDSLASHWQRLIVQQLRQKRHIGVLTGSPLTDVRITLLAGKAHLKHTESGDFRQAACRAVRQALMKAQNVLL